ncbi:type III secretion system inner membrane ring subunit SctD [Lampropedia aestuarii]|nr:type III secretion system inner membrane ring subunit SctD [Lampropedia aestuarii]
MAQHTLELRIHSGKHRGARMPATAGMTLGTQEQADAIVSDFSAAAPLFELQLLPEQGWRLSEAKSREVNETHRALSDWHPLGHAHEYGGIWISIAHTQQEWPDDVSMGNHLDWREAVTAPNSAPPHLPSQGLSPGEHSATDTTPPEADSPMAPLPPEPAPLTATAAQEQAASTNHKRAGKKRTYVLILAIVAVVVFGLLFNYAKVNQAQALPAALTSQDLMLRATAQLPALQLAIAQVDPALRLQLSPQPDGRVQLSGWVASIEALDRLSTAMARQQPPPLMRVRSISEMRTDLKAMLPEAFKHLEFNAADSCCLRISGIMANTASQQEAFEQTKALLPPDLELQNSIRLAETMPQDVAAALKAEGFADSETEWDGQQILATVSLSNSQRSKLEDALLAISKRWPGMPFTVVTKAPANHHSKAPFEIRSVVGGMSPYLVLPGGAKLLPGASHAGWRLQAIEDHAIVFDQPRRITVAR